MGIKPMAFDTSFTLHNTLYLHEIGNIGRSRYPMRGYVCNGFWGSSASVRTGKREVKAITLLEGNKRTS